MTIKPLNNVFLVTNQSHFLLAYGLSPSRLIIQKQDSPNQSSSWRQNSHSYHSRDIITLGIHGLHKSIRIQIYNRVMPLRPYPLYIQMSASPRQAEETIGYTRKKELLSSIVWHNFVIMFIQHAWYVMIVSLYLFWHFIKYFPKCDLWKC